MDGRDPGGRLAGRAAGRGDRRKVTLATFRQQKTASADGKVLVTGILEPVSGDTGLLHGAVYNGPAGHRLIFTLSRFDGIHVLALDGEFQPDGSLKGQHAAAS